MTWPCKPYRRRQAGFTLLEMLVVLLLLGLATALVAPRLSVGGAALNADTRSLAAALEQARWTAVRSGDPVLLRLDLESPGWDGGRLPGTAVLRVTGDASLMAGGVAAIRFLPDGSASGADIRLFGHRGGERVIRVDWLTGRVRHDAG
jgi:general secretion pathway protein H